MDAFYVGVYLLDHPEDRGLAIACGGSPTGRGVVTSASYEARKFGVRSAMPMRRALRLCPKLKAVNADWERIHECSRQVFEILGRFGTVQPMSVDEGYVDITDTEMPEQLACVIRDAVEQETGLANSVGLATSKLVAKVASDHGKPGGCVVVHPGDEAEFLAPLPTRAILGIGPRTSERLEELGIETCGQLADFDPDELQRRMGRHARSLPERAKGIDRREVRVRRRGPKSISGERTFARDVNDRDELMAQIEHLSHRVGSRLRKREMTARKVFVKFRWSDFTTFTRQHAVPVPIDSDQDIFDVAAYIWDAHWPEGQRVRLIGVGVGNLEKAETRQLGLGLD
jgi:DNA polymerase-4